MPVRDATPQALVPRTPVPGLDEGRRCRRGERGGGGETRRRRDSASLASGSADGGISEIFGNEQRLVLPKKACGSRRIHSEASRARGRRRRAGLEGGADGAARDDATLRTACAYRSCCRPRKPRAWRSTERLLVDRARSSSSSRLRTVPCSQSRTLRSSSTPTALASPRPQLCKCGRRCPPIRPRTRRCSLQPTAWLRTSRLETSLLGEGGGMLSRPGPCLSSRARSSMRMCLRSWAERAGVWTVVCGGLQPP